MISLQRNRRLPERYKNAIERSAAGTLTDLMLEESQLVGMGVYQILVSYPPGRGPGGK